MDYCKLIALKVEPFYSEIIDETNYSMTEADIITEKKKRLEKDGCICIVLKISNNITVE